MPSRQCGPYLLYVRSCNTPCAPVHTSDVSSIATPVAYRDASAAGVGGAVEELARGRERVAMTTPDETTATAVL